MIHKYLTRNQGAPVYKKGRIMQKVITHLFSLFLFVAALPFRRPCLVGTHSYDYVELHITVRIV
jgi:hypothetical protein